MADAVTLTCTWGRQPLPATGAPQLGYLLVEAMPAAPAAVAVPLNFCLVLDRSGSMQGAKLESMKAATKRVLELLTPQDVVSIVIFDDTVQTLVPACVVCGPVGGHSVRAAGRRSGSNERSSSA